MKDEYKEEKEKIYIFQKILFRVFIKILVMLIIILFKFVSCKV